MVRICGFYSEQFNRLQAERRDHHYDIRKKSRVTTRFT